MEAKGKSIRKLSRGFIAVSAALASAGQVHGFEIGTGNEDIQIRWDNTVRYNLAQRMQEQNSKITGSLNNNDGDRNFKKNSIVSNRLDLLSEFDFIYKNSHGFRVSAAVWGDNAYNHLDNHSAAGSNHLENGAPATGLSRATKRYNRGVSGEWLDAFLFTKLDIGDSPLYLKAGQHTVYWGESLFLGGVIHGIAYAQSPLDVAKGLSIPGAEAKELFRPLNNISANFQASDSLSLAAQYFFDWKPFRYPEAGSYLGFSDAIMGGGESVYTPLGLLPRLHDIEPDKRGDYGLSARWSPEWLDGTVGAYYRNFTNKIPQTILDVRGHPGLPGPSGALGYRLSYGDDVDLFGVSLSKNIGGVSVGAEISYRKNMPLNSDPVLVASATTVALAQAGVPGLEGFVNARTSLPEKGDTGGARGNTTHVVFNLLGQIAKTPLFDSLDWKAEVTWNTWNKVTKNEHLFKGRSGYRGLDRVSNDAWGIGLTLEPKWYQVFPSVDLMLPIAYSTGLSGVSSVAQGGARGVGLFSVGIAADVRNQYRFDLKYVGFFGDVDASDPNAVVAKDNPAYLKDRGMLVLNFKTTF
ncbi:MAG: DUF1302 domain-containing protein [Betaproteobacteria bacterium HGW-Betaproteobacteria-7]|nr:MAG: DUF1302 domain-containing protein [Betaproteobacteria bacterium HGW-Betaproteobacteria-7]